MTRIAALLGLLVLLAGCGGGVAATTTHRGTTAGPQAAAATSPAGSRPTARARSAPSRPRRAEQFQGENPDVQVTVGVSGTGGGFERFCRGETDLSNASRPIKDEEATICKDAGIEYVEFQVANDALTVVVNKDNDWATCLTVEQLKKIWGPTRR